MLTRQGWLVALGAVVLVLAGRLLGLVELFALGVVSAALLVGAAALVGVARLELEVGRTVHPSNVHVGTPGRVELTVRNLRANGTPVLRLRDPVSGTRGADLLVPPLGRGERTVAAYRLPTDRRGMLRIGPLDVVVGDPFGLTTLTTVAAPAVELTVYPHVDEVRPLPYTTGHDPLAGARQPNSLGRTGEDFYALRPYVVGDDLRRVHWPSSARHDELLVRQHELPWQGRTTLLLDVRKAAHHGESLEVAVSAAASVVAATARRHDLIRLVTTNGSDSDFAPGTDHVEALMEHLAVVPASAAGSLRRSVELLGRRSSGGALVVVLAEVPHDDLVAVASLRSRYGSLTIVHIDRSAWDPGAAVGPPPGLPVLRVTRDTPFASAWNAYAAGASLRGRRAPGGRAPMRSERSLVVAAEVGLCLVTLAAVLGMGRLFDGGSWLAPLTVNAVTAHVVVALLLRRRGLSLPVAGAVTALAALVVATWTSYWPTTALGIPTGDTWSAMQADLDSVWSIYQDVVAPAPVEPGFVLASAFALWCIAFVADWAAFRLWVPFESTLPAGTLFLFTALLGTTRGRGWAVAAFATGVIGFLLVHRMARQDGSSHWVADRRSAGHRSLLTAGASLGVVAVVAGSVLGPSIPGADSPGVLDPRSLRDGDDSRVTISPLVDIRSRLVQQADVEVFRVSSPEPSYWRLTSLERFDGTIWSSSGSYGEADGELPLGVEAEVARSTFQQTFTVEALAAIWLPAAYEPRSLDAPGLPIRYDEGSATLIVDNEVPTSDGLTYQVTSASPRPTEADVAGTAGEVPDDIRDRYLDLPDDFSPGVTALAQELTAAATSPHEQARALQDHLRTFAYDLDVNSGHDGDALETFLFDTRRGYCEQFAGSFAAMARAVGLPARVAVGFTQGESSPEDPNVFRVRGEHAHAWPEVYLAGAGWVAYEPTPGRGMPFAESYTGVTPSQAATDAPGSATTAPPTTAPAAIPSGPGPDPTIRQPDANLDTAGGSSDTSGDESGTGLVRTVVRPITTAAPVVGLAALAYLLLFPLGLLGHRWLRRRRASTPADRIRLAWVESVEHARVLGFTERLSDTFGERADSLGDTLPEAGDDAADLARWLEVASYSVEGADDDDADAARAAAGRIGGAARAAATRRSRVRRWLDPRPSLEGWGAARWARQRRITTTARGDLEVERELVGSADRS